MATASSPLPLVPHGEIVRLNVGGTIFETTLGTLTEGERVQGSRLQATFTQQTNLDNATYGLAFFINADPAAFTHILRWIKHGRVPSKLRSDEDMRDLLLDEARDLNLTGLIDALSDTATQSKRLSQADFMQFYAANAVRSGTVCAAGIDISGLDLSHLDLNNWNLTNANLAGACICDRVSVCVCMCLYVHAFMCVCMCACVCECVCLSVCLPLSGDQLRGRQACHLMAGG